MEILFDETTGSFFMKGIKIRHGTGSHLVESAGLKPIDTQSLKGNETYCRYGKHELWNEELFLGMLFKADLLLKVSLGFLDIEGTTRFDVHKDFLDRHLGIQPTGISDREALYKYVWGMVAVRQDMKTGISGIEVTWA